MTSMLPRPTILLLAGFLATTVVAVVDPFHPVVDPDAGAGGVDLSDTDLLHKHMSEVLKNVDANKDGKISKDEVHAHMNKGTLARIEVDNVSIREKTKKTVGQELKKHDSDKDGHVHFDELFGASSSEPEVDMFGRHKKKLFDVTDTNKDKKLSKEELEFFMHPEVHTRASEYNEMIVKEQVICRSHAR